LPGPGAFGHLGVQQAGGAFAGLPAQPRRQAGPARFAPRHRGEQRGEGFGLDVVGLARAGLDEGPDRAAQSRQEHPGQADGPAPALGLGSGDQLSHDGVAGLEAGRGVQQPGLQLVERDGPVR